MLEIDKGKAGSLDDTSFGRSIWRLTGQIGIYGIGNGLQRLGAFALLPIYISYLSPEQYGLLSLVSILPVVLPPLLSGGLPNAITRYYYDWDRTHKVSENLGIIWAISTFLLLTGTLLLDHFGERLLNLVLTKVPFEPYLRLGLWWSFLTGLSSCPLLLLRIQQRSAAFVIVSALSFLGGAGLIVWAVISGYGVEGVIWMQIIATGSIALFLTMWYLGQVRFRLLAADFRRSISFAFPLVPSAFLEMTASRADRFFLDKWSTLPEIGVYSIANQVGQAIKFYYDSVKPAWTPFYIRSHIQRQDAQHLLGTATIFYIAVLGLITSIMLMLVPEVIQHFFRGGRYEPSMPLIPILLVAYFFQGLVIIGSLAVQAGERTAWQPGIQGIHMLVIIVANMVLTRVYGGVGAAWSMLFSNFVLALLYFIAGQKASRITIDSLTAVTLLGSALVVSAIIVAVPLLTVKVKVFILVIHFLLTATLLLRIIKQRPLPFRLFKQ